MGEKVEDADESSSKREVLLSLGSARQIFVFEIPGNPRQDVWDMLDQAEDSLPANATASSSRTKACLTAQ